MNFSTLKTGCEAALMLAIGMGFGRFAFTAIYPHMVSDGVLSVAEGSLAASANYGGYLAGALLATRFKAPHAHWLVLGGLLGTIVCLLALWLPLPAVLIIAVRALAGVFSAVVIIAASLWLFGQRKQFQSAPFLFSGVGLGIALSSEAVLLGVNNGLGSQGQWLVLSLLGGSLLLLLLHGLFARHQDDAQPAPNALENVRLDAASLILIYGLAGFGYIITATYLPLLASFALPDSNIGHIWAVFGLGAMPSCFFWHRLHMRRGTKTALTANLIVQGIGVLLPALSASSSAYLLSAVLVGGTFMGTVTIVMPVAQSIARHGGRNLMAVVTVAYSIGQILGPIIAGGLYDFTATFTPALLIAASALFAGATISWQKS